MVWNTLLLALRAIRRNLLRSFLTVLGIVIGVAAVITMVALGNGATRAVTDQIAAMGTDQLTIVPGQRFGPGAAGAAAFTPADAEAIRAQISAAQGVAPVVDAAVTAVSEARNWSTVAYGSTADYFPTGNWRLSAGRIFTDAEERSGRAVCVLGETVRRRLFGDRVPLGDRVRIRNFSCEVIGLLAAKGQGGMGADQDDGVVMPLRTVQRRLSGSQDVGRIVVQVRPGGSTDAVQAQITALLRERRKLGDGQDDDFRIMDTRQLAETLTGTTRILTALLGAVAAVSLLVGGIGIMNIMLVSVTERTREIGIRLAVGALEREVLLQFLIEAVVLSGLGGLTGIALATGASMGLAGLLGLPYHFDPGVNLGSFLFSAAIGVIFGYVPARRAAGLDPIDALRYE